MASLNKVILIGNVGNDPEVRYFDGGGVVARFNVATNEVYNNRNGERVEQTEWFRVEVWNEQAKTIEKYLRKGNSIYVEGRLRSETFTDRDGKERFSLNVRATTFQFLSGGRQEGGTEGGETYAAEPAPVAAPAQAQARQQAAAPRQQAAPVTASSAPAAGAATQSRQAAPATRRAQPEPTPFESGGDDDLPF